MSFGDFISGLWDGKKGKDKSISKAKFKALSSSAVVGTSVASAGAAGAGALTGYAGMASAVSTLGLGGLTTSAAAGMGLTAATGAPLVGAAATTAVTAAVGGPIVAGALVVGTATASTYGVYKVGNMAVKALRNK